MRQGGSAATDYLYTGQELDEASGLYNYRARLYDPSIGRFLATDPAGQYPSPYLYVGNDQVNFTDPTGEWGNPLRAVGRAGGAALYYGAVGAGYAAGYADTAARYTGYYAGLGIYHGVIGAFYGIYYTGVGLYYGGAAVYHTATTTWTALRAIYAAATWSPLLTTVTLNSGYGGYKAYGRNETITSGLGRGATMGVVSYYSATFGGGIYWHNLAWGTTTGTFSGGLNAYLWNEDVLSGAGWGGLAGGGFATLNSGTQATRNWWGGYGFLTNEGAVRNLVVQYNNAPAGAAKTLAANNAITFTQNRYGMGGPLMGFDPLEPDFGVTAPGTGNINIGPPAFGSAPLLKATMIHEWGHSTLDRRLVGGVFVGWVSQPAPWNLNDGTIAYSQEILHAGRLQINYATLAAGDNPFFGHTLLFWRKFGWSTPLQYWYLIPRRW